MSEREILRWVGSSAAIVLSGGLFLATGACNQVTKVGNLEVAETSSGDGGASGAASGAGGSGTGVTTGGATQCEYPKQGFSKKVGGTVPSGLKWDGFPEMSDTAGTVLFDDYYDCDGSKGVNAILVLTSATWCGACQEEASELKGSGTTFAKWEEMGIKVVTLMIEDVNQGQQATVKTAQKWKSQFKLLNAVVADPKFTFAPNTGGSIGLPYQIVIDPRTMTIVDIQEGYSGEYKSTIDLAEKNKVAH